MPLARLRTDCESHFGATSHKTSHGHDPDGWRLEPHPVGHSAFFQPCPPKIHPPCPGANSTITSRALFYVATKSKAPSSNISTSSYRLHCSILTYLISRNSKERNKANQRALRKGIHLENILVYDFTSETLETRPIATTYGAYDIYRDVKDRHDVDSIEKKLAVLESEAAAVINIFHERSGQHTVTLKRPQVESVRKFLFIMHYRSRWKTYHQHDHPENAPIRDWLTNLKQKFKLNSDMEVWLHDLRYYLDTPHSQIIRHADNLLNRWGGLLSVMNMLRTRLDPNVENASALAYKNQSDGFFLCVWEAADGEAFMLGNNSFGLWEGLAFGEPELHRIFPISPRIVLVLRALCLRPEFRFSVPPSALQGDLLHIPQDPPTPIYTKVKNVEKDFANHRLSSAAKDDRFRFKITKLTKDQTFAVNKVFMENVPRDGSVTFTSKKKALSALYQYMVHPTSWPKNDQHQTSLKYMKLLGILQGLDDPQGPQISSCSARESELLGGCLPEALKLRLFNLY